MSKSILLIALFFVLFATSQTQAQNLGDDYEEILVFLKVQGIGGYEINSVYSYADNRLFLPVTDLFTALRINQETSERYDSITGYLLDEKKTYLIDYPNRIITIEGDTTFLKENEILKTSTGLYLYTGMFGRIFGLFCTFSFRALSVDLKTDLELPAIRDMRLAQMQKNIEMIRGEIQVDTTIDRQYHLLKFGMFDWAINSTQTTNQKTNTRLSAAIGAEVLGGETNAVLNYNTNSPFEARNQQFSWRWANNKSKIARQVIAGKLSPGSISSIYNPFYGFLVTNAPTSYRRSFGEYNLTGYTEPGWTAELYINGVLINYLKADASGFYSFDVPLVYGASEVVVKFYGPYGEERIREEPINIPYNFLPKGEVEYIVKGGMIDDSIRSAYSRAELSYGVNRFLTLGGGMEYNSFLEQTKEIPFINGSFSPVPSLMFTGEYANKVRAQVLASYRMSSNATFEVHYARYQPGQDAIRFNYLEERKISVSLPIKLLFFNGYSRLGFKQNVYESFNYNTAEFLISSTFGPVSVNLTAYANWTNNISPFISTNLSGSMRLGKGFTTRVQAQIDINEPSIMSYRLELEKRITRQGYASVNYDENLRGNTRSVNVTFRYDLPFAQSNFSTRFSNQGIQTTEGLQGSLAFGSGNDYIHVDNRSVTGRGGITIIPFLDINFNNHKDSNEPLVSGLDLRINGGRYLDRKRDSLTRVMDLEPYTSYLIELNNNGFDNIAWQLRDKAIRVYIDPNQFKRIEIPVYPMGEVNGMVYIKKENQTSGQGRILIFIYKANGHFVKKLMSESDGYFTFLGLAPGEYYATLDSTQMQRLGWTFKPESIPFSIEPSEWGDIVDGIDFTITPDETQASIAPAEEPVEVEKTTAQIPESLQEGEDADSTDNSNQAIADTNTETPADTLSIEEQNIETKDSTQRVAEAIEEALPDSIRTGENLIEPLPVPVAASFKPLETQNGKYFVQIASETELSEAINTLNRAKGLSDYPRGIAEIRGHYKVRFGHFATKTEAELCYKALIGFGFDPFIGMDKSKDVKIVYP